MKEHKCLYCNYTDTDINILKKHEEYLHGCFRDINNRKKTYTPHKHKDMKWDIKLPTEDEIEVDKYGIYQPLVWIDEKQGKIATLRYFVDCYYCNNTISIDSSPKRREEVLSGDTLMVCPVCEKNIFGRYKDD